MFEEKESGAGTLIRSVRLSEVPGIEHGFGLRGVGIAAYLDALGIPDRYTFDTEQVHGNDVHYLMWPAKKTTFMSGERFEAKEKGPAIVGDSFISDRPGMVCSVRTADCVPILISHRDGRFVGAIHAGWKGTAKDIVGTTIRAMKNAFGAKPDDLLAVIGPSISGVNYEVGSEVVEAVDGLNIGNEWRFDDSHVDLGIANFELLKRAGIPEAQIDRIAIDTFTDERFSSWRRDKSDERQLSFIMIRGQ
jgi:YfiH family protein